ncbi:MAG: OmpA family protein [Acidobacteria bacterium]|nr:OmpA family protein [Acidobacteriota bacterium]
MKNLIRLILGLGLLIFAYFHCCMGAEHTATPTAVATTTALATVPPAFGARWQNSKVLLDGLLPNEDTRNRLLARARELYGADGFVDQKLRVSGAEANANVQNPAGWTDWAVAQLQGPDRLKKLNANLPDGSGIALTDRELTVRGVLPDEATRSKLLQELTGMLPASVKLNDLISILGNNLNDTQLAAQSEFNRAVINGIEFAVNQFDVKSKNPEQNEATVNAVAEVLKKYPDIKVAINGHTDSDGTLAPNMLLSTRRASAVRQALVAKGVTADRLNAQGFGPNQPVSDNATPDGKARNRRIDFKVIAGTSNVTAK